MGNDCAANRNDHPTNAIDHAIGRRLTELPMSPPKIVAPLAASHADD